MWCGQPFFCTIGTASPSRLLPVECCRPTPDWVHHSACPTFCRAPCPLSLSFLASATASLRHSPNRWPHPCTLARPLPFCTSALAPLPCALPLPVHLLPALACIMRLPVGQPCLLDVIECVTCKRSCVTAASDKCRLPLKHDTGCTGQVEAAGRVSAAVRLLWLCNKRLSSQQCSGKENKHQTALAPEKTAAHNRLGELRLTAGERCLSD